MKYMNRSLGGVMKLKASTQVSFSILQFVSWEKTFASKTREEQGSIKEDSRGSDAKSENKIGELQLVFEIENLSLHNFRAARNYQQGTAA